MKKLLSVTVLLLAFASCRQNADSPALINDCKQDIVRTEKDFEKMAADKGLAEAFSFFASDSAVIRGRGELISGKPGIWKHYNELKQKDISLKWSPDFVDVSSSCDLGYTYGKYTFSYTDSLGGRNTDSGYFHTVWKKQKDGKWKFVWD
ncbi:MAG: DUF4440 domain-containing protein [Ignavibacteria bacterium]|nr:DUF4440 domain-containing protein [Ignavibacteria bacterium]